MYDGSVLPEFGSGTVTEEAMTFEPRKLTLTSLLSALVLATAAPAWAADGEDGEGDSEREPDSKERKDDASESEGSDDTSAEKAKSEKKRGAGKKTAKVEDPPKQILVAALASYGTSASTRGGLGLRGALEFMPDLFLGVTAQYFFGSTSERNQFDSTSSVSRQITLVSPDVAYNVQATADVAMRPNLGLGLMIPSTEHCSDGDCSTDTAVRVALSPGLTGLYMAPPFVLGVDFRYLVAISQANTSGMLASGVVGIQF